MDRLKTFVQIKGSTNSKWAGFDRIGNISEECLALSNGKLQFYILLLRDSLTVKKPPICAWDVCMNDFIGVHCI